MIMPVDYPTVKNICPLMYNNGLAIIMQTVVGQPITAVTMYTARQPSYTCVDACTCE